MIEASDPFVACLEAEGVAYIFGAPGEENLGGGDPVRNTPIEDPNAAVWRSGRP